jgi:uncharacterized protein YcbK (DUF882 family)
MQLTKNFDLSEFESKDGAEFPDEVIRQIQILANNLQVLRDAVDKPISINSGYRSPEHNKAIKGAKNSFHVKGMAGDIVVEDMTPKEVADKIEELIQDGKMVQGGLKAYSTFTHYDVRGYSARW